MRKTIVITGCGHVWKTGYKPDTCRGCTIDCKTCGRLLIFPDTPVAAGQFVMRAPDFNVYLNERDPRWPRDGANTGYFEFKVPI